MVVFPFETHSPISVLEEAISTSIASEAFSFP
jgi:hypothetical protein